MSRPIFIAAGVTLTHAAALWALQSGLQREPPQVIVPAEMIVQWVPPTPLSAPHPILTPRPPATKPVPQRVTKPARPAAPLPLPLAVADPTPSPLAPTGVLEAPVAPAAPSAPSLSTNTASHAAAPPSGPVAPVRLEQPSASADYLHNPKPPYPPLSKRLGEQGKVLVRVLIGVDGIPQQAELKQPSGFDRLDRAALDTVMRWRYVPGKRAGVAEAMWFNVPISFVLE